MDMKINFKDYKTILLYVGIPLLLGAIVGILTSGGTSGYEGLVPAWIFPIVWSILYILMGYSSYLVRDNKRLMNIYKLNLAVNLIWPFIFLIINIIHKKMKSKYFS